MAKKTNANKSASAKPNPGKQSKQVASKPLKKQPIDETQFREGIEGLKSYLRDVRSHETIDPTVYINPFTKTPFKKEDEPLDYWIDMLDAMPPQPPLGPNPK